MAEQTGCATVGDYPLIVGTVPHGLFRILETFIHPVVHNHIIRCYAIAQVAGCC